jgi:hypothetical protein
MARVFVGIDYGTSSSKVVINDQDAPGGAYMFPLLGPDGSARIPSGIRRRGIAIELGQVSTPGTAFDVYDSVKMRLAVKAGLAVAGPAFYEDSAHPSGWTDEELAVISVAWLQHLATQAPRRSRSEAKYQFLLGVPASFREAPRVVRTFVNVARAATLLRKTLPAIPSVLETGGAQHLTLRRAIADTNAQHTGAVDKDEFADWLQTETSAATKWLVACNPALTRDARAYVLTDIGAGTVNLSALLFRPPQDGERGTSILAACAGHAAVNTVAVAVHRLKLRSMDASSVHQALQRENGLRDTLREPLHVLFSRIERKTGREGPPWDHWARNARIIGIGGGSRIASGLLLKQFQAGVRLRDVTHPIVPLANLRPADVTLPNGFRAEELVNLAVAFGLAHAAGDGPEEWSPEEIAPIERTEGRVEIRCTCDGANEACARCGGRGFYVQRGDGDAARVAAVIGLPRPQPRLLEAAQPGKLAPEPAATPKTFGPVPDARMPTIARPPRAADEPMRADERRHFGPDLAIVEKLAEKVFELKRANIRKPAAVTEALNAEGWRTMAGERWTPRLVWLLLGFVFERANARRGEPRAANVAEEATPRAVHDTFALRPAPGLGSEVQNEKCATESKDTPPHTPEELRPVSPEQLASWLATLQRRR